MQRYKIEGKESNFWRLKGNRSEDYGSQGLQEVAAYYANRLSYKEVEKLLKRITGKELLSDQGIWERVTEKVGQISQEIVDKAKTILEKVGESKIRVNPQIELDNSEVKEIVLLEDGILVKGQKTKRASGISGESKERKRREKGQKSIHYNTDVVILQKAEGGYEYLTTPIDQEGKVLLSLSEIVKAKVIEEYGLGTADNSLNIVAIADGAKNIRCRLESIFGKEVAIILDWYHLCRKVRKLMGSIARNDAEKSEHLKTLFSALWRGKVEESLDYLKTQVKTKNNKALQELNTYLTKHQSEIINYQSRQKAGKPVGSGRIEKGVDLVVANRQKKKGMSWSQQGSQALAILKVVELNGRWQETFGTQSVAA